MRTRAENVIIRRRLEFRGQVQGVGFRPFVYRLAQRCGLRGCVANDSNGAWAELEGPPAAVEEFERDLLRDLPPLARLSALERTPQSPRGDTAFEIIQSITSAACRPEVTADAAVCRDCLRELFDPRDRRFAYPFINCTNCGPRYSIVECVPYDRPNTTMREFPMCPACAREYANPADRRFHAQPIACPACGPQLELIEPRGAAVDGWPSPPEHGSVALSRAVALLSAGATVAIKGLGGYHLACRADLEAAVARLRARKQRESKPLALMVADVRTARRLARLGPAELAALRSAAAPIVLAPRRRGHGLARGVAPGCGEFGLMLPYTPLHHLLFAAGLGPLVMTSANLSGQPLIFRDEDAEAQLASVADAILRHNRRIARPVDDSVGQVQGGSFVPIRRARGLAPRPIELAPIIPTSSGNARRAVSPRSNVRVLAVGGELKSTVCLLNGRAATLSEHLGDLTDPATYRNFVASIDRLAKLTHFRPQVVAHDLHPQYLSTLYARSRREPTIAVQHHHAHVVSLMAEAGVGAPVIGIACDGTGYGTDGAIWGCEVLRCELAQFERLGHLAYFPLVGGDAAATQTWRPAAALLRAAEPETWCAHFPRVRPQRLAIFERQARQRVNAPDCSSLGRVFDAVSYLLGICRRNRHEAQAAMALEAAAGRRSAPPFNFAMAPAGGLFQLDLRPTIGELLAAIRRGEDRRTLAARFHETVAAALALAAQSACEVTGLRIIALSGGCFHNRRLTATMSERLESAGLRVLAHRRVPCGDGGLSLGQAVVAAARGASEVLED